MKIQHTTKILLFSGMSFIMVGTTAEVFVTNGLFPSFIIFGLLLCVYAGIALVFFDFPSAKTTTKQKITHKNNKRRR